MDGVENPADLISRGTSLDNLKQNKIWWEGSIWLSRFGGFERYGSRQSLIEEDEKTILVEQRSHRRVFASVIKENHIIELLLNHNSSLSRVERIVAWIIRFANNIRSDRNKRNFGNLSNAEVCRAHRMLISAVQEFSFSEIMADLQAGKRLRISSNLRSLNPFVDKKGLLRVGGRIQNSNLTFENKHPIILPSDSRFTQLLFEREHHRLLHIGPQSLLYSIRENYWPLRGKSIARKIVHRCVICFKNKPRTLSQIMEQLPADRVTPNRPFFVTGVDFAGPITTLLNRGRGRKTSKSYISLFICFTTKAVHLETVSDLSSASFIVALR